MNNKKGKDLWSFWTTKTESKQIEDAIYNDDVENVIKVLKKSFKEGLLERR